MGGANACDLLGWQAACRRPLLRQCLRVLVLPHVRPSWVWGGAMQAGSWWHGSWRGRSPSLGQAEPWEVGGWWDREKRGWPCKAVAGVLHDLITHVSTNTIICPLGPPAMTNRLATMQVSYFRACDRRLEMYMLFCRF